MTASFYYTYDLTKLSKNSQKPLKNHKTIKTIKKLQKENYKNEFHQRTINFFFSFLQDMMVPIFFGPQALCHFGYGDSKNKKKRFPHIFRSNSLRNLWHNLNASHFWSDQRSPIGVPSFTFTTASPNRRYWPICSFNLTYGRGQTSDWWTGGREEICDNNIKSYVWPLLDSSSSRAIKDRRGPNLCMYGWIMRR
jgi:hypothetical protein